MEIRLLDDNLLRIAEATVDFLPFNAGRHVVTLMADLGATTLRWQPQPSASDCRALARGLDALERDDVEALSALLSRSEPGWQVARFVPSSREPSESDAWKQALSRHRFAPGTISFSGHQPGYLRHLGFFAKMQAADVFTFADDMQFVRCEWHNRQRVPSPNGNGGPWLTVPLRSGAGLETIAEKVISDDHPSRDWRRFHWCTIRRLYGATPFFDLYAPFLQTLYARRWRLLNSVNEALTRFVAHALGVTSPVLMRSSDVEFPRGLRKGHRIAAEILAIVDRLKVKHLRVVYLTGPGAHYLNRVRSDGGRERDFLTQSNIAIRSCSMNDDFLRDASHGLDSRSPALVFLFNLGPRAGDVLRAALRIDNRAD